MRLRSLTLFFLSLCLAAATATTQTLDVPEPAPPGGNQQNHPLLFREGALTQVALPQNAEGQWVLRDHQGQALQSGVIRPNERTFYFGDLAPGAYALFYQVDGENPPGLETPWKKRVFFLCLPSEVNLPEDHFFAVNAPELAANAAKGNTEQNSQFAFFYRHVEGLGLHRVRTPFYPEDAWNDSPSSETTYRWFPFEEVVQYGEQHNALFISILSPGSAGPRSRPAGTPAKTPPGQLAPALPDPDVLAEVVAAPVIHKYTKTQASPDYITALLRHFGFRLDEFCLWPGLDPASFPGGLPEAAGRASALYRKLKERSPYSAVALGLWPSQPDPQKVRELLSATANAMDVVDLPSNGPWPTLPEQAGMVETALQDLAIRDKWLALSSLAIPGADASMADALYRAEECIKKIAWARFKNFRYVAIQRFQQRNPTDTALFLPNGEPHPLCGAYFQAIRLLGGKQPVERLGFAAKTHVLYGFASSRETVLVVWVPRAGKPGRPELGLPVTIRWPDGVVGRVEDAFGMDVSADRMAKRDTGAWDILLTGEPAYLVISTSADNVKW